MRMIGMINRKLIENQNPTKKAANPSQTRGAAEFTLLLVFCSLLIGCIPADPVKTQESAAPYTAPSPEDIPAEIEYLEKVALYYPEPSVRADAYLRLALLYSSYKNPDADYDKALENLRTYFSLNDEGDRMDEAQNLLYILTRLETVSKTLENAEMENRQLKGANKALTEENNKIKETIKKLKSLDLELEEKRRKIN